MEALTIKDLLALCLKEYRAGHEDYVVFVTDDEEANGYHALWFNGCEVTSYNEEDRNFVETHNKDLIVLKDKDKAIYIG